MAISLLDNFWHRRLNRPYILNRAIDVGNGTPTVIMLHGIGRSGGTWQIVAEKLSDRHRVVAYDLLGFGLSPKPAWPSYTTDDHVRAVVGSINKLKTNGPVILVGHSMGCLVAVRLARQHPEMVKHLVLYEMPLYDGLPNKRIYKLRTDLYFRFYKRLMNYQPVFTEENQRVAQRLAKRAVGFEMRPDTWKPFVKSLEHTIMSQTAADDIKKIRVPMDVIYGTRDMLVIRGKAQKFFGKDSTNITSYTIRERHVISAKASKFIVERVEAANEIDKQYGPK